MVSRIEHVVVGPDGDGVLLVAHHDRADGHLLVVAHDLAEQRVGLLGRFALRRQVVGGAVVDRIDVVLGRRSR